MGHHAAGADDTAIADRDARQHDRATTNPHATADVNWLGEFQPGDALCAVERVRRGVELHRRRHLQIIADLNRRAIEKDAVVIDKAAVPETDIVAVIAMKARLDIRIPTD